MKQAFAFPYHIVRLALTVTALATATFITFTPSVFAQSGPHASIAARSSTCDYTPRDPFVGCWVIIHPPQWRGVLLNVREDGSWFNDWPENLASGRTRKIGTHIDRDFLVGFGPYLKMYDMTGRIDRAGPYFTAECAVMRIDPAPDPVNSMLGALTGEFPEPVYHVRLRSPLKITPDVLTGGQSGSGGFTGNPGDAEIVTGIPDDPRVPAFNNCSDNFEQTLDARMLFAAVAAIIPASRMRLLLPAKFLEQISPTLAVGFRIGPKVSGQMARRGWTEARIYDAINRPVRTVRWTDTRATI